MFLAGAGATKRGFREKLIVGMIGAPGDIAHAAPVLGGDNDIVFKQTLDLAEKPHE